MSGRISFYNLEEVRWYASVVDFQLLLYHGVIRNSSPERLPKVYPEVESEIMELLNDVDPERYPHYYAMTDLIVFSEYSLEEQREFLAATRRGLEDIRNSGSDGHDEESLRGYGDTSQLVALGEKLIDMMERSLAKAERDAASEGAAKD